MPSLPKDCGKLLSGRQSFSGSGLPPQDGHAGRVSAGERRSILLSRPFPFQPNHVDGARAHWSSRPFFVGRPATRRWRGAYASKGITWNYGRKPSLRAGNGDACGCCFLHGSLLRFLSSPNGFFK
uniref:Uncharacterized protein n=1 Tax=Oryza barthii TaxID=65489 RepID=A0A0D3F320_9ORYZ